MFSTVTLFPFKPCDVELSVANLGGREARPLCFYS